MITMATVHASVELFEPAARTMRLASSESGSVWTLLLVLAVTLPPAFLAALLVRHLQRSALARSGAAWQRLGKELGLGRSEIRLLRRLTNAAGLEAGGGVLLSAGCFDHMVAKGDPGGRHRVRLNVLRQRLHPA